MRDTTKNISLAVAALIVSLVATELVARYFVEKDEASAGILAGVQLPPLRIIPPSPPSVDPYSPNGDVRQVEYGGLEVDGTRITGGDLWGYYKLDGLLGYTVKENTASVNGWWQSNNIGARAITQTTSRIPKGTVRFLLFGESYGQSSRVKQNEAWSSIVEFTNPRLELVNLAVDGYSMGQAYLRYKRIAHSIDRCGTILMFVPGVDLWRDINTIRDLAEYWNHQIVAPRFVLDGKILRLVKSPYSNPLDVYSHNENTLSPLLKEHLRQYDRFYFPALYESPPIIGKLVLYKLVASVYGRREKQYVKNGVWKADSEAMKVSLAIFKAMRNDEVINGRLFVLLVLPEQWQVKPNHAWQKLIKLVCQGQDHCVDLRPALQELSETQGLDTGYDHNHYGPRTNKKIAERVSAELSRLSVKDSVCHAPY